MTHEIFQCFQTTHFENTARMVDFYVGKHKYLVITKKLNIPSNGSQSLLLNSIDSLLFFLMRASAASEAVLEAVATDWVYLITIDIFNFIHGIGYESLVFWKPQTSWKYTNILRQERRNNCLVSYFCRVLSCPVLLSPVYHCEKRGKFQNTVKIAHKAIVLIFLSL